MVAKHQRALRSGKEYDALFPAADFRDDIVNKDGSVRDTVPLMAVCVSKFYKDCAKIAPLLKASTLAQTCSNIWYFLYHHIQYRLDKHGVEQLRAPRRAWAERAQGVDCDCFSITISSILTCLGIPHKFRVTKYDGDWQHVYVVVPDPLKKKITSLTVSLTHSIMKFLTPTNLITA